MPSACVLELDLVAKGNGINELRRAQINERLATLIARSKILPLTPFIVARACRLVKKAKWHSMYFDLLIAATALEYNAEIVTTDRKFQNLGIRTIW